MRLVLGIGATVVAMAIGLLVLAVREPGPAPTASSPSAPSRSPSPAPAPPAPTPAPALLPTPSPPPSAPAAAPTLSPPPSATGGEPDARNADLPQGLRAARRHIQGLFDARDFQAARTAAATFLATRDNDNEVVRVMVLASCAMGEADDAQSYYRRLEGLELRKAARRKCRQLGYTLQQPPRD